MSSPFATDLEHQIHAEAVSMVDCERIRQLKEKGHSCSADDSYESEELASAAVFLLLPSWFDQPVAYVDSNGQLTSTLLSEMIAEQTFEVSRDDGLMHIFPEHADRRIKVVTKALALGLAELERLLRLRNAQSVEAEHGPNPTPKGRLEAIHRLTVMEELL